MQADATESYYFFSNDVPAGKTLRQVIEDISHQPGVRFVAQFEGEHKIFGAVDHDTLEADVVCVGLRASASAVACEGVWPATPRDDALRDAICAAIRPKP